MSVYFLVDARKIFNALRVPIATIRPQSREAQKANGLPNYRIPPEKLIGYKVSLLLNVFWFSIVSL